MVIDAAIAYRRRGFSVIPIKPKGKKPLVAWESYQNDPASEETIRKWFASWPDANVAVVTGQISDVVVIDLDSEEAKAKIKALVPDYDLSAVPRVRTAGGDIICFSSILAWAFRRALAFYRRQISGPMAATL